ncbi:cysteine proteinase [Amylocystis lapponica]|nr:cysteine proteinase [Amylocystis lapponica]
MAGSKKKKPHKTLSPSTSTKPPSPPPTMDDDELMDELMAQLDSKDQTVQAESADVLTEMRIKKAADSAPSTPKQDSKTRHQARQARKAAALVEKYSPSDPEADARLKKEADDEDRTIKRTCDELGLEIFQVTPDGHCLFSAVADQLALLSTLPPAQATYATCRHAAANYIHSHPNDFLPFLPSSSGEDGPGATTDTGLMDRAEFDQYCVAMRDTAVWGGEPEILALSSAFNVPIHVVQGGPQPVVVHQPLGSAQIAKAEDRGVVHISYHRRLYGLGEHYNSLRPKSHTVSESLKSAFHS